MSNFWEDMESVSTSSENTERSSGGYYIKNGIIYDGSIDTMLSDLYRDMGETLREQKERNEELEASGEVYMDGAGIIHNASWEQDYRSLMVEVPKQIEAMEKINRENYEKGIFPPRYDGFVSNPFYDPTGSWSATMNSWDTINSLNTPLAPDYAGPDYTREELEQEIKHSVNMAGQYGADGFYKTADSWMNRAEHAAEKLRFAD